MKTAAKAIARGVMVFLTWVAGAVANASDHISDAATVPYELA
jgi:hypothetical protein